MKMTFFVMTFLFSLQHSVQKIHAQSIQAIRERSANAFAEMGAGTDEIRRVCGDGGGSIQESLAEETNNGIKTTRTVRVVRCNNGMTHQLEGNSSSQNRNQNNSPFSVGDLTCTPITASPQRSISNCPGGRLKCQTSILCESEEVYELLDIYCDCEIYDQEDDGPKKCLFDFYERVREKSSAKTSPAGRATRQ